MQNGGIVKATAPMAKSGTAGFAVGVRRQRVNRMSGFRQWRGHLDEMYVLNGEMVYLWRAVDPEDEILDSYITRTRNKSAHGANKAKIVEGEAKYGRDRDGDTLAGTALPPADGADTSFRKAGLRRDLYC